MSDAQALTVRKAPGATLAWLLPPGIASSFIYFQLLATPSLITAIPRFELLMAGAFAIYLAASVLTLRGWFSDRWSVAFILGFALVFRLTLLPMPPSLSTDILRYLWDGKVQSAGINPYLHPPNAPELSHLSDPLAAGINHPDWVTIYPPGAELLFRLAWRLSPGSIFGLKLLFLLADAGAALALGRLLARRGLPLSRLLLYAWNPLVVFELFGSGHVEGVAVALLLAALLAAESKRSALAGGLLAAGTLVKVYPVILLPLIVLHGERRARWRGLFAFALIVVLGYAIYIDAGPKTAGSLFRYLASEEFNPGLRAVIGWLLLPVTPDTWQWGRALSLGLLAASLACVVWVKRSEPPATRAFWLIGTYLVLIPDLFPWYVIAIVPFLALFPSPAWAWLSGGVLLSYFVFLRSPWSLPGWVWPIEFLPFYGLLAWEAYRSRIAGALQPARLSPSTATPFASSPFADSPLTLPLPYGERRRGEGRHQGEGESRDQGSGPLRSEKISVIIPALNEEAAIGEVLKEVPRALVSEIIVVDNGSHDHTAEIARDGGATVVIERERGYGAACWRGALASNPDSEILVYFDGDGSERPDELHRVVAPILERRADLVLGSRWRSQEGHPIHARLGNQFVLALLRFRFGLRLTDIGPFRAIRRQALLELGMTERSYGWPVEMIVRARKRGLRIVEVPVSHRPRIGGESKVAGTLRGSLNAGYAFLRLCLRA